MTEHQKPSRPLKRKYKRVEIGPLPGEIRFETKNHIFIPKHDTKPHRIKKFLVYCEKHQGFPREEILPNKRRIYHMVMYNRLDVRNSVGGQAVRYGLKMTDAWGMKL